jgi:hypothetical protein
MPQTKPAILHAQIEKRVDIVAAAIFNKLIR